MILLRRVAMFCVGTVTAIALVGASLPRQWLVIRRVTIAAPPERIHPFVVSLQQWPEWTAWNKSMDPQLRITYEGSPEGVGSRKIWVGPELGHGLIELTSVDLQEGIRYNAAIAGEIVNGGGSILYKRLNNATEVEWTDEGRLPPIVGGFVRWSIESNLTVAIDKSLATLKGLVEASKPTVIPQTDRSRRRSP